jgi:hypothetical protein
MLGNSRMCDAFDNCERHNFYLNYKLTLGQSRSSSPLQSEFVVII